MRAAFALACLIATTATAVASDTGPVIVIPGRPGVPIMINGVDASYAVVEGDWGLAKGQHVQPTVYGGHPADYEPHVGHYYPTSGHLPGYGRLEIEPPTDRKLPQPGPSYNRSWSAQSAPPRAQPEVPLYPPPVIVAPQNGYTGMPREHRNEPQNPGQRRGQRAP